jgi:hypothetical protein
VFGVWDLLSVVRGVVGVGSVPAGSMLYAEFSLAAFSSDSPGGGAKRQTILHSQSQ